MTISRYEQVTARAIVAVLVSFLGVTARADNSIYVFQVEVGFGGKHPASSFYVGSQSRLVLDADDFSENSLIRIPLYSTDHNVWTLYRTLRPRPIPLALEDPTNRPSDVAPTTKDEPTQDSAGNNFGRILAAGGALGVLVYLSDREDRRECTSAERALCIVGSVAGGGGCGCKF